MSAVTFERLNDGREIARAGGKIVGDITPDGFGHGGWADYFAGGIRPPGWPCWVESRAEAHTAIEETAAA